jgi:O-antigen/teichoic acid export membrane protein
VPNIALNIYLIPKHGAEGAAAATALSLICVHILRLIEVAVIFKMVPYDKHYFKLLAPGLAAALAFASARLFPSLSPWIFLLFCAGGLFLYGGILYLFGLPEEDRIVLTAVKNKIARISS